MEAISSDSWGLFGDCNLHCTCPAVPAATLIPFFLPSPLTFRRGQIGDYLIDFTQDHHELFEQSAADLLGVFGYADRWKIARVFSVMLPTTYELSRSVASQLRSEFASHGRDFSSIVIHVSGEHVSADFEDHLEVEASRIGDTIVEDKIRSRSRCATASTAQCPNWRAAMHHDISAGRWEVIAAAQVNAIIEALIKRDASTDCRKRVRMASPIRSLGRNTAAG